MIRVREVSKTFRAGQRMVQVLSGVCLDLEAGQTLAVAGRSGSGKTTLLNCIGGLDRPDAGEIFCMDTEITALGPRDLARFRRRHLGFMFQAGNLISYLTLFENIAFPLQLNGYGRGERVLRVRNLMEELELTGMERAMPRELSGGQAQRAAFARAIAHLPALLLADEPTASLDSTSGKKLIRLMTATARHHNITVITTTHDTDIIRHADRTIHIIDGKTGG